MNTYDFSDEFHLFTQYYTEVNGVSPTFNEIVEFNNASFKVKNEKIETLCLHMIVKKDDENQNDFEIRC